ncbi:MAG: DUF3127 domain-containing protein [Bacteroidales bacterium]|nr:DUF3127 domain-containing protein [Bacteroidales bacterium]MCL2133613.1 DUF3127 domain-containing protein [Bacteroidales bacterium]
MALEITGKLIKVLPLQSGTNARGTWSRQEFVLETLEQYPRKVCVSAWGERVNELSALQAGDILKVSFSVESREYNERWYTDVRAFRIEKQVAANPVEATAPVTTSATVSQSPSQEPTFINQQEVDDLPF